MRLCDSLVKVSDGCLKDRKLQSTQVLVLAEQTFAVSMLVWFSQETLKLRVSC